ncbi:hypothetical protein AVEN_214986-1 [Araneus ventricosus]|uniref:Uncharacterized protein n=1 Tax=Araneus ventricosus TaxID=182803 RepID=A0A4Y2KTE3_ARAVE|nr:hypothetical protein AVEN_214986-1 [Araneus ventricosus]
MLLPRRGFNLRAIVPFHIPLSRSSDFSFRFQFRRNSKHPYKPFVIDFHRFYESSLLAFQNIQLTCEVNGRRLDCSSRRCWDGVGNLQFPSTHSYSPALPPTQVSSPYFKHYSSSSILLPSISSYFQALPPTPSITSYIVFSHLD